MLEVCREGHDLTWTITNRTELPLWAFVAPPSRGIPVLSRDNAILRSDNGNLLLTKHQGPPVGDHPVFTGAIALRPGESDRGVVRIGRLLDRSVQHLVGVEVAPSYVLSVALEIGFAEQRPGDRTRSAPKPLPFVLLIEFDRARQEHVRSPALAWQ